MKLFNCFRDLFGVIINIWLTYWAHWYFEYSLKLWKTSDILRIPMFYAEGIIFIGFALMLFFGIVEFIDDIKAYINCGKADDNAKEETKE